MDTVLLSSSSVWQAAFLAASLYLLYRVVAYQLFFSPLASLPNAHWSSALSPLWILYLRRTGRENRLLLDAHQRLGPIVRIGPHDISISDPEYVRVVYGGGFDKTDWYAVFDNYGVPCMFSTRPAREHSLRKRWVTHVYSKSFIQSSPAAAAQIHEVLFSRLLPILDASGVSGKTTGLDVFPLFLATSMDSISSFVFGSRCGTDFLRNADYRAHWLKLYLSRHGSPFFPQELPALTGFLRRHCGFSPYPRWVDQANAELAAWNRDHCDKAMEFLAESGADTATAAAPVTNMAPQDDPVVLRALLAGLRREKETRGTASLLHDTALRQHALSVQSELFDHVLAGHETTGIVLTYLAWHLSRRPDMQDALRQELTAEAKVDKALSELPPYAELDRLPLLHAIIMETLRLHAPIPGPQPRQTPAAGCHIGPYTLPGGVRIAALAHTLHRDGRVFPEPLTWDPQRWLDGDEEQKRARTRMFWAFSSGGRMCVGSNFAMHEMKTVLAAIYSRFSTHIVDDTGIEQTDSYTTRPRSEQLRLRFERLA